MQDSQLGVDTGGMKRALELAFRHRSSLLLILVVPIASWALVNPPPSAPHMALGAALLAAGVGLRLWAARCLGKGARVHRARARDGVVDWGPYAFSRNPLYIAAALILAGIACFAGAGWWGLCLLPATLLVYLPVVTHEEASIRATEGESFVSYFARVPRWIGIAGRRERDEPTPPRYAWRLVLKREAGLLPGVSVAVIGITVIQRELVPVREFTGWLTGDRPWAIVGLCSLLMGLGAVVNSVLVERKSRRKTRTRAAIAAAEAANAAEAAKAALG